MTEARSAGEGKLPGTDPLRLLRACALVGGVLALLLAAVLLLPVFRHSHNHRRAEERKCSSNLRLLGLAALQYSDDKRVLPHLSGPTALDGPETGNHQTKTFRALHWYGYHDSPESWICPSSFDMFHPVQNEDVREHMRKWFWGARYSKADTKRAPFVDGAPDPPLSGAEATTELSYGWTRRALSPNAKASSPLSADRSVRTSADPGAGVDPDRAGNHLEGWNVLRLDGRVEWITTEGVPTGATGTGKGVAWLRSVSKGGGFLAITDQTFD